VERGANKSEQISAQLAVWESKEQVVNAQKKTLSNRQIQQRGLEIQKDDRTIF
jgi:hypothetical protein